jgi:hypothetical protein
MPCHLPWCLSSPQGQGPPAAKGLCLCQCSSPAHLMVPTSSSEMPTWPLMLPIRRCPGFLWLTSSLPSSEGIPTSPYGSPTLSTLSPGPALSSSLVLLAQPCPLLQETCVFTAPLFPAMPLWGKHPMSSLHQDPPGPHLGLWGRWQAGATFALLSPTGAQDSFPSQWPPPAGPRMRWPEGT